MFRTRAGKLFRTQALAVLVALTPLAALAQKKEIGAAPTNVQVVPQGGAALVTWAPLPSTGVAYLVTRGTNLQQPGAQLGKVVGATSFADSKLEPGVTYFYQVVAVYADGTMRAGAPVSFTLPQGTKTPAASPGAPTGARDLTASAPTQMNAGEAAARAALAASAVSNLAATPLPTSVRLTWTPLPTLAGYAVERSLTPGQWSTLATVTTAAFADTLMNPDTPVQYRISAKYPDGRVVTSNPVATRTTRPVNPANLRAAVAQHIINAQILPNFQALATASGDVTLTWDAVAGASNYEVSGPGLPMPRTLTATTLLVPTVARGVANYQVIAYFMNGPRRFGDATNPSKVAATIGSLPVDGFNAVTYRNSSAPVVDFRWGNQHGATSFKLLRADAVEGPYAEVPPNFAPFWARDYDRALERNRTYYYKLLSIFPTDPVAFTSPVTVFVPTWADITGVSAVPQGSGNIMLRWTPPAGASSQQVLRATGSEALAVVQQLPGGAGGWLNSGLAPGTTYRYSICAFAGQQKVCADVTATTSTP